MIQTHALPISGEDIQQAHERLRPIVYHTPLLPSERLSQMLGVNIFLKTENLQKTGSFKIRGAYNKVATLTPEERARGLIAASSGNHAQGVAYAARAFGIHQQTTIYMPQTTPQTKIDNTRRFEVNVELVDGTYDRCSELAHAAAEQSGATYIEPYNDWRVIAGQGTVGLEILQDLPETDVILVPVGGGGLISGIALAAHASTRRVRVYGVHATYAKPSGYTIADGIRVKHPGDKPLKIIPKEVEQVVSVDEDTIAAAVLLLAQATRLLVEGAGAVGLAALLAKVLTFPPQTNVVLVLSGGNIDISRLQHLA